MKLFDVGESEENDESWCLENEKCGGCEVGVKRGNL